VPLNRLLALSENSTCLLGVLAKVDALLAEGGASKSSILTASIWVKSIPDHFAPMNEVQPYSNPNPDQHV